MEVLNDNTFNYFIDCKRRLYGLYLEDVEAVSEDQRPSFILWCYRNEELVRKIGGECCELIERRYGEDSGRAFRVCRAIYNNHKARSNRLKNKIESWNKIGNLYFITLTFNDKALEKTTSEYRRKAVQRYFNNLGVLYCANVDFGDKNGREHYHAVICTPDNLPGSWVKENDKLFLKSPFFDKWAEEYGYYNILPVNLDPDRCDSKRIAKYISKLTNHALKKSASGSRFICNRKIPSWVKERGIS